MIDLKDYVCVAPFEYLEITNHGGIYGCCPGWMPKQLSKLEDVASVWESDTLKDVQQSVMDGSYKYCSTEHCPALNKLVNNGIVDKGFFQHKDEFKSTNPIGPKTINYAFDKSCNLSCPSCRTEKVMANTEEIKKIEWVMSEIEKAYGSTLQRIYLSGTADPFASKSFRKLLTNFDKTKYPKVYNIQLHTNALLLNKEMWDEMKDTQRYIKTMEISIDAATKKTYEIVRRGGDWDILIDNLKFISMLPITDITLSMVVQDNNYMEMFDFYESMIDIFGKKGKVFFKKITNWNTFSNAEFKLKEIHNPLHPEFNMFLLQLQKIDNKFNSVHNFHDIISEYIPKEIKLV
jgi:sulfatase maturation enzyme AslB (radical SAM superfamily)